MNQVRQRAATWHTRCGIFSRACKSLFLFLGGAPSKIISVVSYACIWSIFYFGIGVYEDGDSTIFSTEYIGEINAYFDVECRASRNDGAMLIVGKWYEPRNRSSTLLVLGKPRCAFRERHESQSLIPLLGELVNDDRPAHVERGSRGLATVLETHKRLGAQPYLEVVYLARFAENIGPHLRLSDIACDSDCLVGGLCRLLGFDHSGLSCGGSISRVYHRTQEQKETNHRKGDANPSSIVHVSRRFRHTLLGGEITLFNAAEFAIGILISLSGFLVGLKGLDLAVSRSASGGTKGWGAGVVIGGAVAAVAGGVIAVGLGYEIVLRAGLG
ncbi:hypothetical protein HW532_12670 [Kaustia mangrovi]|uniref:Uncharacterized protein n=1 Tax=Kaustia mangrovi TaxID=2593653 RepID=A0A7S8HCC2_9HYPH|nr:hypothetical protein [Kaustia mangrovi]QPC43471.1 hypothetical protein HW532_12670 [Kaustia mangrovi]